MGDAFVLVKLKETVSFPDFERFMGEFLTGYSNLKAAYSLMQGNKVLIELSSSDPIRTQPIFERLLKVAAVLGMYDNLWGHYTEPVYSYVLDLTRVRGYHKKEALTNAIVSQVEKLSGYIDIMVFFSGSGFHTIQIWTKNALSSEDRAAHQVSLSPIFQEMGVQVVYEYPSLK